MVRYSDSSFRRGKVDDMDDIVRALFTSVGIVLTIILLLVVLRLLFPKEARDLIRRTTAVTFPGASVDVVPVSTHSILTVTLCL